MLLKLFAWIFLFPYMLLWTCCKGIYRLIRRAVLESNGGKEQESASGRLESRIFVAGVYYRESALEAACDKNPFYEMPPEKLAKKFQKGERIYKYKRNGYSAYLVEEPTNPHDENAIMVMIAGRHVGYIPREMCVDVKKLMRRTNVRSVPAHVNGGRYKVLDDEEGFITVDSGYSVELELPVSR